MLRKFARIRELPLSFVSQDMSSNSLTPDSGPPASGGQASIRAVDEWFDTKVLPLEPALMRLLRRHWRYPDDHTDLRQDIYVRVYEAALRGGIPDSTVAFIFSCARNLLVDRVRRSQAVPFEAYADLEDLSEQPLSDFTPEDIVNGRQELRLLQLALDDLSPRCREVIVLRKFEGLSQKEISNHLGIAVGTIEKQITLGVRAIAETLYAQGVEAASVWMQRMRRGREDQ